MCVYIYVCVGEMLTCSLAAVAEREEKNLEQLLGRGWNMTGDAVSVTHTHTRTHTHTDTHTLARLKVVVVLLSHIRALI